MVRWILAAVGVFVLAICISAAHMGLSSRPRPFHYDATAAEADRQVGLQYEEVSLVTLLANPDRYDGRKLRVGGYVTLDFEDSGLHLDKTTYDAGLRMNALRLDPPKWLTPAATRRLNHRYDEVAGLFRSADEFHRYSGVLTEVRQIRPTATDADFQRWRLRESRDGLLRHLLSGWFLTLLGWMGLAILWLTTRRTS